jgi:uncharacterized membrane protein
VTSCKAVLSLAVLLLATVPLALAQGTYTQIDYPGAYGTYATAINNAGDVVGWYESVALNYYGFLLSGGVYSTISCPGGLYAYPAGINDDKQIVGTCFTSTTSQYGFSYDSRTEVFTTISYPGATWTQPFAINDAGTILAIIQLNNVLTGVEFFSSGRERLISPPGSTDTQAYGISAAGEAVGFFTTTQAEINFAFVQGHYNQLTIPASSAHVIGINPQGTAFVGSYTMPGGSAGFVYQNGLLTTVRFPGSHETVAYGINTSGVVVGQIPGHGFTWTPPADAAKK